MSSADQLSTQHRLLAASAIVMPDHGKVDVVVVEVDIADLAPNDVVVAARCSVISPGTELAHYSGDFQNGVLAHSGKRGYPFYPGYAMAGSVIAAGSEAGLVPGQRVLSHTPHTSVARFDRSAVVCLPLPADLDDTAAPFARLAQVGGVSLQASAARAGDVVAVVGLGAIGNLAAQLAKAAGMEVVGVDLSEFRREVARRSGIARVVAAEDAEGHLDAMGGARVVLECSGRAAGVVLAAKLCARYGEIFTVGAPWTVDADVPASAVVAPIFEKYLALRGGWEWQVPRYGNGHQRSIVGCTSWTLQQMAEGTVTTQPLVTAVVTPEGAMTAYETLSTDPDRALTFLIDWGSRNDSKVADL